MREATTTVRRAEPSDWQGLSRTLANAFEHDPVFAWLLPDAARRRSRLEHFFAIESRHVALEHGASFCTRDLEGAVLVLPPGQWRTPPRVLVSQGPRYLRAFGTRAARAGLLLAELERRHVRQPHYYVAAVGVAQSRQGQGLGTALLEPVLHRCDEEHLPAYLEASSPRNASLYRRLGFATQERVNPLGSPPIELMLRPAA